MTFNDRRKAALFPLATMLAIVPTVWLAATASAEERKLAILLAYPIKQDAGAQGQAGLPNTNDIFDAYFDKFKNGQNGGPRVDSHAEWWEEISYGDVTVSGEVFGWVNLPWRTLPENPGSLGGAAVPVGQVSHINLIGGTSGYLAGQGEGFDNTTSKYRYDFDGRGGAANGRFGNFSSTTGNNSNARQPGGAKATDDFDIPVFTPGERFLDLNGNRIYDAGVYEWGIDKNGNGYIDVDKEAASWFELVGACIQYERDEMGEPLIDDPDCPDGMTCPQIPNPDYMPELQMGFLGWETDAEWYDSNGDGRWNLDKRWQLLDQDLNPIPDINPMTLEPQISQEIWNGVIPADPNQDASGRPFSEFWPSFAAPPGANGDVPICDPAEVTGPPDAVLVRLFRGDWGGTEIWMDNNGNFAVGGRATQDDRYRGEGGSNDNQPAALFEYVLQFFDPESDEVEYFDEQFNTLYDFPEPFEDFLVRWDADAHQYVEIEEDYIRANYPGNEASMKQLLGDETTGLLGRIGNHRYDAPDVWGNNGTPLSTNKLQRIDSEPVDGGLRAEWNRRNQLQTPNPSFYGPNGWSFEDFWDERFGTTPPDWDSSIPLFVRWNPANPLPPITAEPDRMVLFAASAGGETGDGTNPNGDQYREGDGTVVPTLNDGRDGMYDGPAEYVDLPSSIYHSAGDGSFGEITGPGGNDYFGSDLGVHNPNNGGGVADRRIPAAGPLAFNVHGDQGWDGGNVLSTELATWQTEGAATDDVIVIPGPDDNGDGIPDDNDMDGQPDFFTFVQYHRDINLDGMIDLGETVGVPDEFGIPGQTVLHSYGMSPISGESANGDPSNFYPHNRTRAMEDTVEALDDVVDWDDFLGGAGAFGNSVYGVLLLPAGTGPGGMFTLPASVGPGGFFVRTRDRIDPNEVGINRYVPISFFDGMGIEIGGMGEGGGLAPSEFQISFAGHEYGHIWEGWPDLYDYDVRLPPPLNIVNNPIGAWCVMAGGGLVHPVPILKADSGWINPIDVTRALNPGLPGTIQLRPWEFDRNRTVYKFSNPLFSGEEYWFWATHPTARTDPNKLTFDRFMPGNGLMVMRSDRGSNDEGLPPQQRIADGRFTYQIIQGDGLQQLENGSDFGDAGDPFPGASGQRSFTRETDPAAVWGNGEGTGLDIVNIARNTNGTVDVTFRWSPRELPTMDWIQPPPAGQAGPTGISVNGTYQLRYLSYDQFGGTTMRFFAQENVPGEAPGYDLINLLGVLQDGPGEVIGGTNVSVAQLPDGTYTFYAQLMPGIGDDNRMESAFSEPRAQVNNFGDGTMTVLNVDTTVSFYERWNVKCIADNNSSPPVATGSEKWSVIGSISGRQADATTGQTYTSNADNQGRSKISFRIDSRVFPFRAGDEFIFVTTGLTPHSSAVLVSDGEVVPPEMPDASAQIVSGGSSGLAPHTVTFKHDLSSDPLGASLNFVWDFGDGSQTFETDNLDAVVTHTYTQPRTVPYQATLTAINIFGLSDTVTIPVTVSAAQSPDARIDATPRSGEAPLTVSFDAGQTTDPNPGTETLDYVWDFGDSSPISTEERTSHTYTSPGIYVARLTVTNRPYGQSSSQSVEIRVGGSVDSNLPPVAAIDVDRTLGAAPLNIKFNADRSIDPEGSVLDYTWDFGDGSSLVRGVSSTEHSFQSVGTFNVTLTVEDILGQTDTASIAITVTGDPATRNQAPFARISTNSRQGSAPFTATFDARDSRDPEDGSNLTYEWNFDDADSPNNTATGAVVTHTFEKPQAYDVVLRVFDSGGASGSATVRILVNANASQGQSGQENPGTDPDDVLTPTCGAGCGPMGLMPMALMLIGVGGMRISLKRRFR